jgi:hypothetical protein
MSDTNPNQDDTMPTPGLNEPVPAWPEYRHLKEAIHDYLDDEPDDPQWQDIWRALAAILGEYQRDAFVDAFDLAEPAERPCVRRLITGEDECSCLDTRGWEERELEQIGARDEPPHKPPHSDHATLWLDEDEQPALYSMHLYPGAVEMMTPSRTADPDQQRRNGWFDICDWAAEWGLEVGILPKSWYNIGSTVHIIFYPPERYRSASDS